MRNVIEWTLVSADGVLDESAVPGFLQYQDDAYLRDGLGLMTACEAMLFGRSTYQMFAKLYQGGRVHPWASRLNAIPKYVFSSTLGGADWDNSTLVPGDAVAEVTRLKQQEGGDLLIFGHGLLAETLLRERLTDVIDLSVYPVLAGSGKQFFRDGQAAQLRLAAVKTFSNIVKLTYLPQH
ncbi:MAG TPA: dihydrofolate reductase family protein [Streptosporangiaceae bacterium]|jgi:dihydrofolate reductase|nr:dihydrofolate reductase family protein [Streptosporangiaceae bacterium]